MNILHCIDYRTHAEMFFSSHYLRHHSVGDLTYQSTFVCTIVLEEPAATIPQYQIQDDSNLQFFNGRTCGTTAM